MTFWPISQLMNFWRGSRHIFQTLFIFQLLSLIVPLVSEVKVGHFFNPSSTPTLSVLLHCSLLARPITSSCLLLSAVPRGARPGEHPQLHCSPLSHIQGLRMSLITAGRQIYTKKSCAPNQIMGSYIQSGNKVHKV